jgi:hypothetical protein
MKSSNAKNIESDRDTINDLPHDTHSNPSILQTELANISSQAVRSENPNSTTSENPNNTTSENPNSTISENPNGRRNQAFIIRL